MKLIYLFVEKFKLFSNNKTAWKRKMAAFHPDKIQGKDLDPEWIELANQKSAEINQAYETIKAARNL